jgi:ACS family pantothenate transporter-like MFS transporter
MRSRYNVSSHDTGKLANTLSGQILTAIRFPSMMVIWAALTMGTAGVKSYKQICAIRFFQGLAEASTFSGTNWLLGSWYTKSEIGKRTGIFVISGMAGTMFSGENNRYGYDSRG